MEDKTAEYLPLGTDPKELLSYKQVILSGVLRSVLSAKYAAEYGIEQTTKGVKKIRNRTISKVEHKKERDSKIKLFTFGNDEIFQMMRGERPKTLPNGQERRIGVVILGGANACCINTGEMQGLIDSGAFKHVDGIIGISGGAITGMYVAAGNSENGVRMIFEENTKPDFLDISDNRKRLSETVSRLATGTRDPIIDTTAFARRAVSDTHLNLNLEKIRDFNRELNKDLFVVVTNVDTGLPEYINVAKGKLVKKNIQTGEWEESDFSNSDGNILKAMTASVCLPAVSSEAYTVMENGQRYSDGGIGDFVPLEFAFRQFTDVLILSNYPLKAEASLSEHVVFNAIAKIAQMQGVYPDKFVEACRNFPNTKLNSLKFLQGVLDGTKGGVLERVAVIAPFRESVDMMEKNGEYMRKVYEHTRTSVKEFFKAKSKAVA